MQLLQCTMATGRPLGVVTMSISVCTLDSAREAMTLASWRGPLSVRSRFCSLPERANSLPAMEVLVMNQEWSKPVCRRCSNVPSVS